MTSPESAERLGLDDLVPPIVARSVRRLRARRRTRTALGDLAEALEDHLPRSPAYYVELGANDGVTQSNTYWLERERGWRGLLIEPALNRYFDLRRNRSVDNSFACAACVPFGYEQRFVTMEYADLMTVATDLPSGLSDVEAHLDTAESFLRPSEERVTYGASARTLQSLLDEAGSPAIVDFLSLDVEGAELAVLQGVDHERTRFCKLLVECRDLEALRSVLEPHEYALIDQLSHHDYLFADRSA